MQVLDEASDDGYFVVVPTLAIAEAQAVIGAASDHWYHVLRLPSLRTLDLSPYVAVAVGRIAGPRLQHHPVQAPLIGPLMTAQVLHEARSMTGVIVTSVPEAYGGHEIAVHSLN
ncbi:hypothetical protein [Actinoplanes hulinensis]|nr:hypothetical protein [Actinoplanes hulinensis]